MASHKHEEEVHVDTLEVILTAIQQNLVKIIGGFVVLIVLIVGGFMVSLNKTNQDKIQSSAYATALDIEDAKERATALGMVANSQKKHSAEAVYMQASSSMEAADYDTAKAAYTTLIDQHPTFEFTPDAAEGLGIILQEQGDYTAAITQFEKVASTWPKSFAAKRQSYNIGVCHEKNENFEKAIAAYKQQLEVFLGSSVAAQAQQKLNELYAKHPDLEAPEELVETVVEVTDVPVIEN